MEPPDPPPAGDTVDPTNQKIQIPEPLSSEHSNTNTQKQFPAPALSHSRMDWSHSKLISIQGEESSDEEVYDPEDSAPLFDRQESEIPEEYEHVHTADAEEFQLIPHHTDKDKWKIYIPIIFWFPRYKWKKWFLSDFVAAMTAIVMVIPQGMGYALVAGLKPIYGLYSALMGHCLYGPFGTSGQLIVAPVAIVSLMTKESLHVYFKDADHSDPDLPKQMAAYASALAFQVGIISLVAGFCKAGILANMLAEPVIVGFTFAAAILIGVSQLQFVFRFEVEGEELIMKLISFFKHISLAHWPSVLLGICCIVFLLIMRFWQNSEKCPGAKYIKFVPSALILVVICTSISYSLGEKTGWNVVGELPKGLPSFVNFLDYVDADDFWTLWVSSILITVLSFIESIAVATKFADKHDYSIDASQELIALGICNLIGCWFQIYPVSGVLSLATVVEAAGALTPLYCNMAGIGMIICCAFLLFLFEWLPKPVLGSIVFVGIINLIDIHTMKEIWKVNRKDFLCMIITIVVTLFIGIDYGVALGVAASIVLFIQKAAKPHYGVLGRIKHADVIVYRNVKHHENCETRSDMLMIRWDASIFFANTASFKRRIRKQIGRFLHTHEYPKRWCLALCFSGVNDIDYTGVDMLKTFFIELKTKEKGMSLILCKLKTQVLDVLYKHGVVDIIGKDHVLWELHEAELWWNHRIISQPIGSPIIKRQKHKKHRGFKLKNFRVLKKNVDKEASASLLSDDSAHEIDLINYAKNNIENKSDGDTDGNYAAPHVAKNTDSESNGSNDNNNNNGSEFGYDNDGQDIDIPELNLNNNDNENVKNENNNNDHNNNV